MRLYAPLYEGDSFLRPDAALGERAPTVFKTPANETVLDLNAIEQTARVMRGAAVGRLLKAAYTSVVDWLERIETRERDNFFAASANLSDLEQRQRHWERTGCASY